MKSFIEQARFYAVYHQKPVTRYTHFVGVPLIIFSLMVFFGFLHLIIPGVMDTTLASILTFVVLVYYIYLNWRLGLVLVPVFIVLLWLANLFSLCRPHSNGFVGVCLNFYSWLDLAVGRSSD